MVQIRIVTASRSMELMERANTALREFQEQLCTMQDVQFSLAGLDPDTGGGSVTAMGVLIRYNTPAEPGLRPVGS